MTKNTAITVIGTGALGSVWVDYFRKAGYPIVSVWNSSSGTVFDSGSEPDRKSNRNYSLPADESEVGDVILITTPDSVIESVTDRLAVKSINWSDKRVIHCSGSQPASILDLLAEKGAAIASVHPIQTFKKGDDSGRLKNIYISLQGDKELILELENFVMELHSTPLILDENQKKAVHISAVFASNYLVALLNTSDELLKEHGVEDGVNILEPLIRQTLLNILEKGSKEALSGPISRGDFSTVQNHLENLSEDKQKKYVYEVLGRVCLSIVKKQGTLTSEQISDLESLFE